MKHYYAVIILLCSLFIFSCKSNSPTEAPAVVIAGIGDLVSDEYINQDGWDIKISGDPQLAYGFDADNSSKDVYSSVEVGKSNTFRVYGTYKVTVLPGSGSLISSVSKASKPVVDYTYVNTVTANNTSGSQMLSINEVWNEGGNESLVDLENCPDAAKTPPVRIYAKVYSKTILTDVNIYYLYNTSTNLPNLQDTMNKIYAQAVCVINSVDPFEDNPDKSWDLNGNGKLDIYPNDESNAANELTGFITWASGKGYGSTTKYGIIILDKPFVVHGTTDKIYGKTSGNISVISSDANYRVVAHEYLHSDIVGNLEDILDEYNLMYYLDLPGEVLRYRTETRYVGGTEPSQWQTLNKTTY